MKCLNFLSLAFLDISGHLRKLYRFFDFFCFLKEKVKQTFQEIRLLTHQLKTTLYADILQQYNIESFSFVFSNSSLFLKRRLQ